MHHRAPESDQRVWFWLGHSLPGVGAQVLAGDAAGISVISSQGWPLLATAHSRLIQWPHHSPWLSPWQPRWWCFRNNVFKKGQNAVWLWGVRKNMRETVLRALRQEQQEGRRLSFSFRENHGDGGWPLATHRGEKSTLQLIEDLMLQQSYPEGTAAQAEGPDWSSPWRSAAHEEDPGWSRKQRQEEGIAERSCYGLTTDPIPHPLRCLVRRE